MTDVGLAMARAFALGEVRKFREALTEHTAMAARERNLSATTRRKRRSVTKSYRRMALAWSDAARRARRVQIEREAARREERRVARASVPRVPAALNLELLAEQRAERLLASIPEAVGEGYARVLTLLREERRRRAPDENLVLCLQLLADELRPRVKGARKR